MKTIGMKDRVLIGFSKPMVIPSLFSGPTITRVGRYNDFPLFLLCLFMPWQAQLKWTASLRYAVGPTEAGKTPFFRNIASIT